MLACNLRQQLQDHLRQAHPTPTRRGGSLAGYQCRKSAQVCIPLLPASPEVVRFRSGEPLLGPLDRVPWLQPGPAPTNSTG